MNHQLYQLMVINLCPSVKSVAELSIKNNKVCKTKPILSACGGFITPMVAKTNNKKQRTMNNQKQSQTNPKQSQFWAVFEQNKPNQSQNKANPVMEQRLIKYLREGGFWGILSGSFLSVKMYLRTLISGSQ